MNAAKPNFPTKPRDWPTAFSSGVTLMVCIHNIISRINFNIQNY